MCATACRYISVIICKVCKKNSFTVYVVNVCNILTQKLLVSKYEKLLLSSLSVPGATHFYHRFPPHRHVAEFCLSPNMSKHD